MGIIVQRPEDALLPFDEELIILINSGPYYREISYQLTEFGYKVGKNFFILNFKVKETLLISMYFAIRAIRGMISYKNLLKSKPEGTVLFIAPYTGTGDIYLSGLFFEEYLKKNNIKNYIFVVVSGACKKVAELFCINNIKIMDPRKVDDIINANLFMRTKWPLVVLNDGWLSDPAQWIRGYKDLHFEKIFRKFVFKMEDDVPHKLPEKVNDDEIVDETFRKHKLKKNKTVVLSPYSNTLFEIQDSFWEEIAECCKENGYSVCTNCAGEDEYPIRGTIGVFFSLKNTITFMNKAGYFIGVRSGLCDVISSSSCKKVVLYEKEGLFYKSSTLEYFSLKKMGICHDAIELEYRRDIEKDVKNQILKLF